MTSDISAVAEKTHFPSLTRRTLFIAGAVVVLLFVAMMLFRQRAVDVQFCVTGLRRTVTDGCSEPALGRDCEPGKVVSLCAAGCGSEERKDTGAAEVCGSFGRAVTAEGGEYLSHAADGRVGWMDSTTDLGSDCAQKPA